MEKQKGNVPKKFQNAKDLSVLERILQYIASKKKEGVYQFAILIQCRLLKDIYVLINESTIKCNDYLNVLIKLEEIVRTQTKKVLLLFLLLFIGICLFTSSYSI